jgi:NitT/TauT family transport system permease protein
MKIQRIIGPVGLLILWIFISSLKVISPIILPTFKEVLEALVSLLITKSDLWIHIGLTLYRTLVSFLVSIVFGVPLGLLMGFAAPVYRSLEFIVDFFRSIPPIALFPIFLLTLGLGETSKLGVSIYGCILIIIINSVYGVQNAPMLRRTIGKVYGFSRWQIFWKIVFPDSLPQVFIGMRTALSLALVLTIVVEMFIGSNNGLGKRIYDYHLLFDSPKMYATIIVTGFIGYILNQGFILFERSLIHWCDK